MPRRGQPHASCQCFSGLRWPLQASPGTPGGVKPSLCSVPGDCTMTSICPFFSRKSFSPEKAQIELACLGAAVSSSEPAEVKNLLRLDLKLLVTGVPVFPEATYRD